MTNDMSRNETEVMGAWSAVYDRAVGTVDAWCTSAGDSLEPIKAYVHLPDGDPANDGATRVCDRRAGWRNKTSEATSTQQASLTTIAERATGGTLQTEARDRPGLDFTRAQRIGATGRQKSGRGAPKG